MLKTLLRQFSCKRNPNLPSQRYVWHIKRKVGRDVAQGTSYEENTRMKIFCNLEGKGRRRSKTGQLSWENSDEKWERFAVGALFCRTGMESLFVTAHWIWMSFCRRQLCTSYKDLCRGTGVKLRVSENKGSTKWSNWSFFNLFLRLLVGTQHLEDTKCCIAEVLEPYAKII